MEKKEEKLGDPVMWCVHVLFFIENLCIMTQTGDFILCLGFLT